MLHTNLPQTGLSHVCAAMHVILHTICLHQTGLPHRCHLPQPGLRLGAYDEKISPALFIDEGPFQRWQEKLADQSQKKLAKQEAREQKQAIKQDAKAQQLESKSEEQKDAVTQLTNESGSKNKGDPRVCVILHTILPQTGL